MNEIESQSKSVEALKSFNNIIVTSRLYPPDAPQVATAIDRGYKILKDHLRLYGDLSCSVQGGESSLCGQPLKQETLDLFPNLVVYRQLRLLGLAELIINSTIDRFAFGQLISVFNASAAKIKMEGGGAEYITSLGLASYFPDESGSQDKITINKERTDDLRSRNLVSVRPEIVACVFDKDKRPVIAAELKKKMATTEMAIDILAACVAYILLDVQKEKMIVASPNFPVMLEKADTLIEAKDRETVALGLAKVFVESLKEPALCVVLAQQYTDGFGSLLYNGLMVFLSTEQLAGVMVLFREQLAKARRIGGVQSPQVQFLGKILLALMNSKKGKHFLSTQKVSNLIHKGERERKKQRLEAGIRGILQGNTSLLKNEELLDYLPEAIQHIQKRSGDGDVAVLLKGMVDSFKEGVEKTNQSLLNSIITIVENFAADSQWSQIDLIIEPLMEEVRKGGVGDVLMEKTATLLQQVMQKSWQAGENDRGDKILTFLHQIRLGDIRLAASIKTIVAKVQDKGIIRANLPNLLAQCLRSPKDKTLSSRLIFQGPVALRFLVDALIKADEESDRLTLLELLSSSPNFLSSVVHERLQEHMPWYGKRNLIKLLGESGNEEDAESVLPYLNHDDFRVQREAFLTLYKVGGRNRKRLLLKALEQSSELINIHIIEALASCCDSEVAEKLVEMVMSHERFGEKNRNDLLLHLMETLGKCKCSAAQKGIHAFLSTRGQRATRKISAEVWAAGETALRTLQDEIQETRKKHLQASQLRKNALKQAAKLSKIAMAQRVITGLPQEQAVRTLLSRGQKNEAAEQILELIERAARLRNFVQAESLREWLIEIDSVELSRILRAAEIIDSAKVASIDKSHLEIWGGLYDILTTDEFSAVYHALKHTHYDNEELVIGQGALQGSLFFINSGKVKLYFDDNGSDVLVKTMGRGEIFGSEAFFEASVWTISVAAIEKSDISVLKVDTLEDWAETFPGLESKLSDFCKKSEKIEDLIRQNSTDRRLNQRYKISGRVVSTLLDKRGRSIGTNQKVELRDISEGGISFLVRISQKENARLLLGRKIQINLPEMEKFGDGFTLIGDILSVRNTFAVENDYLLNMKFDKLLDRKQLDDIVIAMPSESQAIK